MSALPRPVVCAAAMVLGLASCGNAPNDGTDFREVASQYIAGRTAAKEAPVEMPSRAVLDAFPAPLIRVSIPAFGVSSILGIAETNGAYDTWLSPDRTAFIIRDGVLTGTRGLLENLLAAQVPNIRSGSTRAIRDHYYSGDNERAERVRFDCVISAGATEALSIVDRTYIAQRIDERCKMDTTSFENTYWVEGGGKVRKSRQWVSPRVGYVTIEAVNR